MLSPRAIPPSPPSSVPAQVQKTTTEPVKPPTIVTTPASPKPVSSTLFVAPKAVATPASPFDSNKKNTSDLKNGASPSPAPSAKATSSLIAKPVLKPRTAPLVVKPKPEDIKARENYLGSVQAKQRTNEASFVKLEEKRQRELQLAGASGAGLSMADQADYDNELAILKSDREQLKADLSATQANLTAEQNALRQREFLAPRQPSFLEQVFGFIIGLILLGMTGGALTMAILWFSGYNPVESVKNRQLIKRPDSEE